MESGLWWGYTGKGISYEPEEVKSDSEDGSCFLKYLQCDDE